MLNDRESRAKLVDQLRAKIKKEKDILQERVDDSGQASGPEERPFRPKRLSEVFEEMGF